MVRSKINYLIDYQSNNMHKICKSVRYFNWKQYRSLYFVFTMELNR